MDLESESSALEYVEDNELTTANPDDSVSNHDHVKNEVNVNGSCSNDIHNLGTSRTVDTKPSSSDGQVKEDVEIEQMDNSVNSQPSRAKSPVVGSPPVNKGYGLRKWRRIRRDVVKESSAAADISKVLKRGFSNAGNPSKPTNLMSSEIKQNSEGSTGSVNMLRNVGVVEGFVAHASSLEPRFAAGSAFHLGTDSENSEGDRSSKSSTAASVPKPRWDLPTLLGFPREKNKIKNLSGKNVGSSTQRVQLGKVQVDSSKKPRGEKVKIEKENSHSSMESDSRSSNFVFAQGICPLTSNGNQSERSMNYDGENSDDAHGGGQQFSEEVQTGYRQKSVEEEEDDLAADSAWKVKQEKSTNHWSSTNQDPLVESLITLQSVQKSLENEVQKLGEIGKVCHLPVDSTSAEIGIHESSSSDQFDSDNVRKSSSLESQLLSLRENVKYLESRLEEANAMLKLKDSEVAELESTLITGKEPTEESGKTKEPQQEISREIENELESSFKQKIEAEVEYLILTSTIKKLRVTAGDQITLFEQQETLASEQAQILNKLGEAEKKAVALEKQAEEVEKYSENILETEEVLKMQTSVFKVTSCFSIQLVLLILGFWLLALPLSPHSGDVVPT